MVDGLTIEHDIISSARLDIRKRFNCRYSLIVDTYTIIRRYCIALVCLKVGLHMNNIICKATMAANKLVLVHSFSYGNSQIVRVDKARVSNVFFFQLSIFVGSRVIDIL